ncbi:MAG: hypothetical protein D6729_06655, partial [Deltaproteobacteria bacterium]
MLRATALVLGSLFALGILPACTTTQAAAKETKTLLEPYRPPSPPPDPEPRVAHGRLLIRGAKVMTAAGDIYEPGYVLVEDGRIAEVGPGERAAPEGAAVVEG